MKPLTHYGISLIAILFIICSCKKKNDKPSTVATLTTTAVTNITSNAAASGGTISDDGGATVTTSGICWSKTNANPTINDDTTKGTVASGSFISNLKNLSPSSNYYVRAYAINSVGVAYGNVVTFTTGNAAPIASSVSITGLAEVNKTLTGVYTYADPEGDAQSGSTFQWYVANDAGGTGEVAIVGATALTYVVQSAEQGKYIRFGVIPKASTGTTTGVEVRSPFVGAVGEATTVTFTYNGSNVTYGILTSATTGKKWLDRNLGAPNTPTGVSDYANYGDLFQWGRLADGHQLITRNGPNDADMVPVNGTSPTLSATDVPGHSLFILKATTPFDWRAGQNNNLWQGATGINNPCPSGWRLPTAAEWIAENLGTLPQAFTKLKITYGSQRAADNGGIYQSTTSARYWTSSVSGVNGVRITIDNVGTTQTTAFRANGYPCRCIKD